MYYAPRDGRNPVGSGASGRPWFVVGPVLPHRKNSAFVQRTIYYMANVGECRSRRCSSICMLFEVPGATRDAPEASWVFADRVAHRGRGDTDRGGDCDS